MPVSKDAVGKPIGPIRKTYDWKDVALYGLSVGAGFKDRRYCHEDHLETLPTFAMAAVFDFFWAVARKAGLNPAGILHGEQEMDFHAPIPVAGELITEGRITDIFDKGPDKGALVVARSKTHGADGTPLFTGVTRIFGRKDGGFGGPDAPSSPFAFPDRPADVVVSDRPSEIQPLLYRLTGDLFALHADPDFARRSGFKEPIMHGLCTLGYACRALLRTMADGRADRLRKIRCRFSAPLYPDTPIETRIWKLEPAHDADRSGENLPDPETREKAGAHTGAATVAWRVVNAETGETIIDRGMAEFGAPRKAEADPIRFDGRVALITGAGGGLGRAYALALAERGAKVAVNDLPAPEGQGPSAAERVVEEIRSAGGEAIAVHGSVSTPDTGERIVRETLDALGSLDILINNAGILRDKSFAKMAPEQWGAVLDVHVSGAYNVTRPAFAAMKAAGYGRILMITSAAGLYGNFGQANYGAAKMALVGLMNTLKLEGANYNIRVNAVAPVAISRMTEGILPPDLAGQMPPELVSPLALFLSGEACPVTGGIYNAGMGCFSRAALLTGPAVRLGDAASPPTPEAIRDHWEAIQDLSAATEITDAGAAIGAFLTARPPAGAAASDKTPASGAE